MAYEALRQLYPEPTVPEDVDWADYPRADERFMTYDPFYAHPSVVVKTYLSMRKAHDLLDAGAEVGPDDQQWRLDLNMRPLSRQERAELAEPYEERIVQLLPVDHREGAALMTGFATHREWQARHMAAKLLPNLVDIAPDLTFTLLKRLENDYHDERVAEQAAKSLRQIDVVPSSKPPTLPCWERPEWRQATEWASEEECLSFLEAQGYTSRIVAGARRTISDNLDPLLNKEAQDLERISPYPTVGVMLHDGRDLHFELTNLRAKIEASTLFLRSWKVYAAPRQLEPYADFSQLPSLQTGVALALYAATIQTNLSAISEYINYKMPDARPLSVFRHRADVDVSERNVV